MQLDILHSILTCRLLLRLGQPAPVRMKADTCASRIMYSITYGSPSALRLQPTLGAIPLPPAPLRNVLASYHVSIHAFFHPAACAALECSCPPPCCYTFVLLLSLRMLTTTHVHALSQHVMYQVHMHMADNYNRIVPSFCIPASPLHPRLAAELLKGHAHHPPR